MKIANFSVATQVNASDMVIVEQGGSPGTSGVTKVATLNMPWAFGSTVTVGGLLTTSAGINSSNRIFVTVPDGAVGIKMMAATAGVRIRYVDATIGTAIEALNLAENAYTNLTLTGNPDIKLSPNGILVAKFTGSGLMYGTDNTYDIGAVGDLRPRTGYFGTHVIAGGKVLAGRSTDPDTVYARIGIGSYSALAEYAPTYDLRLRNNTYQDGGGVKYLSNGAGADVLVDGSTPLISFITYNTGGVAGASAVYREQFRVAHTASAVNYVSVTGSATGTGVQIQAAGSDTNINFNVSAAGTGAIQFNTLGGGTTQFKVVHTASAVNCIQVSGRATANPPTLQSVGSDTNVDLVLGTQGAGTIYLATNGISSAQCAILHTASANRYITFTGSNGGNPTIDVSAGALKLSAGTSDIQWGKANVALGGGAAPTVGTIGGSGPAAAAQRNWLRFLESDGTASFIPVWR